MRAIAVLLACVGAATAEEGWVTHAAALSPRLDVTVRGRMHAERGTARLWIVDAKNGALVHELRVSGPIRSFAFRADGERFVASADHGGLRLVETATGRVLRRFVGHESWVHSVAFARDRIASAGRKGTVRLWDAERGVEMWRKEDALSGAVALSPDATLVVTSKRSGEVHVWDAATGKLVRTLDSGDGRWPTLLAFSNDGSRIAAGWRTVRVFEVASGKTLCTVEAHAKKNATAVAFSKDGRRVAIAGPERAVRIWRVNDGQPLRTWKSSRGVAALAFTPDTLVALEYWGRIHRFPLDGPRWVRAAARAIGRRALVAANPYCR